MILMLSGWKRSGKDAAANFLVEKYQMKRLGFADVLKDLASKEFDIPRDHFDNPEFKEKPILNLPVISTDSFSKLIHGFMYKEFRTANGTQPEMVSYLSDGKTMVTAHQDYLETVLHEEDFLYQTPRSLAILKGSTNRSVDPNYWVDRALQSADLLNTHYVIADFRYPSEIESVKAAVKRLGLMLPVISVRIERFASSPSQDPSERALDNYQHDFKLNNQEGVVSLKEYYGQIDLMMGQLEKDFLNPSLWA